MRVLAWAKNPSRIGDQLLVSAAIASVVMVVVVPEKIAEASVGTSVVSTSTLPILVNRGFESWIASGSSTPAVELQVAAKFWCIFHVAKLAVATVSFVVFALLLRRLWKTYVLAAASHRRSLSAFVMPAVAACTALLLLVIIANIQGSFAPLTSVLSFLPRDHTTPAMEVLQDQLASGVLTPTSRLLLSDFWLFHAVVVVCSAAVVVGLVVTGLLVWMRWANLLLAPTCGIARIGLALTASAVFMGVVLLANLSTVLEPLPALSSFLSGSL